MYYAKKMSSQAIGKSLGIDGRFIRRLMARYGIKTDLSFIKKGIPAPWNRGPRPQHVIEAARVANTGRIPHNKGDGDIERICEKCGINFTAKAYRKKRFCCAKCRNDFMAAGGESHWNFSGGGANKHNKRLWKSHRKWRDDVVKRDGGACVLCRSTQSIEVHHIDGFAYNRSLQCDVSNGVTLCKKCHRSYHKKYGKQSTAWKWRAFMHHHELSGARTHTESCTHT